MNTTIDKRQKILLANATAARALRQRLEAAGTLAVNLISSPGSGKTTLLEATAKNLAGHHRMAAVVGDVATEMDAERLRAAALPAHQIVTAGACHLDARMVEKALDERRFGELDILFIENVGNLVCPTSYDLGEAFKVALLSVTEGADKPFKYPGIFAKAAATVITKFDLLPYVPFDLDAVRQQILTLNPEATILTLSAHSGEGMQTWCRFLEQHLPVRHALASS